LTSQRREGIRRIASQTLIASHEGRLHHHRPFRDHGTLNPGTSV
jgi:hypothetical protein